MKGLRIAVLCAGAGALLLAAGAASAQEGVVMKNILGDIGIIPKDRGRIDYRERAPLVLPPKFDLRQPVDPASVESRAANWPNDPDVADARKQAIEARKPTTETEFYKLNEGKRLSGEEMRAFRRPGAKITGAPSGPIDRQSDMSRLSPDELRAMDKSKSEPVLAGAEPERELLTDPPAGYRKPAAGAPLKASVDVQAANPDSPYAFHRRQ